MTPSLHTDQPATGPSTQDGPRLLGPPMDIAAMLSCEPPPLDEVLPGLPAGTVGMLAGPGGVGKTFLELQLAAALATGAVRGDGLLSAWGGERLPEHPARVVLVAAEEPPEVLWQRLRGVVHCLVLSDELPDLLTPDEVHRRLAENLRIHALSGATRLQLIDEQLRPTGHVAAVHRACEGARLVLLDPLRQLHLSEENASNAMSALVSVFKRLAHHSGAAVVFAHHTSRAAQQFGLEQADAARGSTALTADTRWQANLSPLRRDAAADYGVPPAQADHHALLHLAKSNYSPPRAPLLLQRQSGGVLRAVTSAAGARQAAARRKR